MLKTFFLVAGVILVTEAFPRLRRNSLLASSQQVGPFKNVAGSGNQHLVDNINTYSLSPAEAYFGTGAHSHSLPIETSSGDTAFQHGLQIGDWSIDNEVVPQRTGIKHGHNIGGVDSFGSKKANDGGIDYSKHFQTYRNQLVDTHAAQGTNPHPHLLTPTAFLGKSPFHHETGIDTGEHKTPFSHKHNINGLNIAQQIQPVHSRTSHGHQLPGVDNFKSLNHEEHFSSFIPHHANHVGTSSLAKASATNDVKNPNLDSSHIAPVTPKAIEQTPGNPFFNTHNQFTTTPTLSRFQQYAAKFLNSS